MDFPYLYTLNNRNWDSTGSSISAYNIQDRTFETYMLGGSAGGCGASADLGASIIYQKYSSLDSVFLFSKTLTNITALPESIPDEIYGIATDNINNIIYIASTDYFSSGQAYITDFSGNILNTFSIGISAGNIVLDIVTSTNVVEPNLNPLSIFPNPTSTTLNIKGLDNEDYKIYDIFGKLIIDSKNSILDVSNFNPGAYLIKTNSRSIKFVTNK
jgi:hypothetical protein